ncbi:MAG: 3-dehydroquinate synthase [Tepidisphaeraceae bacterium]
MQTIHDPAGDNTGGTFSEPAIALYNPPMDSKTRTIHTAVPGSEYDITVRPGLLAHIGDILRKLTQSKKAVVVTDDVVGNIYGSAVESSLRTAGFTTTIATVPTGEKNKTLATISTIYDTLLTWSIERTTPVLALGGGVVGDMAGFAAATVLRGVPFVQIPTTLLAMVDASVGGKTGVDHAVGKNLIGAFHQPIAVLIDPAALKTLPPRELRSGLAECIKHDIIRDAAGFADLERNIRRALALDIDYLADLVAHNVAIKARVVAADPFEKGERAHLNFGHTFGHAIETISNYAYAHGECVALGMVAACHAAKALGMIDRASCDRVAALLRAAELPTKGLTLPIDNVVSAMIYDKKVKSGNVRFVLPSAIGAVTVRDDVPAEIVRDAVASLT